MRIVIHNRLAASFLLENEPNAWDSIAIIESGTTPSDFLARQARRHPVLRFDDIEVASQGRRLPTADDVRRALEFATDTEKLLVCCRAGQSRSAAIALAIGCRYLGVEAGVALLDPRRHIPNAHLVELAAATTGDPTILAAYRDWRAKHQAIRLTDFYDEIEREFDALEARGAKNRIIEE